MSKLQNPIHSRSHNLGGTDPATIGTSPSSLMGAMIGAARLTNGLGINMGTLYLPDRDGSSLESGETITVSYSHFEPVGHFDWMAARAHIITTVDEDDYDYLHPWQSDPWNGGIGATSSTDPYPTFGGWTGFVCFAAVTNDDGETVTWTLPDIGATAEQFSFDDTGVGHIGYLMHDFGARDTGDVTVAYSGASTERVGSIVWSSSPGAVTVGDMVGEEIFTGGGGAVTSSVGITLTEDIPEGSQLLIVSATKGTAGFSPTDAGARPQIIVRAPSSNFVPKYRVGRQQHMLPEQPLGGTALGSSGAPSGSAGGDLTGTYPNPTIDANKVTEGKIGLSDVTTDNASTSKHGFLKKLDNNAAHFMDGTGSWSTPSGSGGVASDTIWDAKGDLAAGTGADTASKLTVGSNDQVLVADSTQSTGLKWAGIDGGGA